MLTLTWLSLWNIRSFTYIICIRQTLLSKETHTVCIQLSSCTIQILVSIHCEWLALIWGLYAESHWIVVSLSCGSIVLYVIANHPCSKDIHLHCLVFPLSRLCPCFHLLIFPSLAPFALLFRPVQGLITFIMVSIRATEYRVIKVENRERETDTEPVIHDRQTEQKSWRTELYRSERERRSQCFSSLRIRCFYTQRKGYEHFFCK